tara:strand:- start:147 stop:530 length:384 start_codon:yes stop_codon:yes gene_type:complete
MRTILIVGLATLGVLTMTPHPGAEQAADSIVTIVAERFSFTPSEVHVLIGTTLELRIRSDDTMHGFRIVGGNVNILVPKRRQGEAVVNFEATEAGRYEFECSRLCGAGHNFMRGAIVVHEGDAEAGQ